MIKFLIIILIILAAVFLIGGGYFLGLQGNAAKNISTTPQSISSPAPSGTAQPVASAIANPSATPVESATPKPVTDTITAIENAFISENFESLKPNLADSVMLIAYATSCCGSTTDYKKVAEFISGYVSKGKNWTFNPKDAKYDGLRKEADLFVVAEDGRALVFKLDNAKKLSKVTFYSSYQLASY